MSCFWGLILVPRAPRSRMCHTSGRCWLMLKNKIVFTSKQSITNLYISALGASSDVRATLPDGFGRSGSPKRRLYQRRLINLLRYRTCTGSDTPLTDSQASFNLVFVNAWSRPEIARSPSRITTKSESGVALPRFSFGCPRMRTYVPTSASIARTRCTKPAPTS